jgi:hypothetical protein
MATWVIPAADNHICEVTQIYDGAGGSCMPLERAVAGKHVSTTSVQSTPGGPETIVVSGLVPDGTAEVKITTSGKVIIAPVHDNVYFLRLDDGSIPKVVSFETPDANVETQVPFVPANAPRASG